MVPLRGVAMAALTDHQAAPVSKEGGVCTGCGMGAYHFPDEPILRVEWNNPDALYARQMWHASCLRTVRLHVRSVLASQVEEP